MAAPLAARDQLERGGPMQGMRVGNRAIWRKRRPGTAVAE
jgi:hypothetical protein